MIITDENKRSVGYKRKKSQVSSSSKGTPKLTLCEKVMVAMNKKGESHSFENVSGNVKTHRGP